MATAPHLTDDWICRTFDAAAVNAVCNDPAVQPTLSLGKGVIDVSAAMEDRRNVFMLGQHGGVMFHWSAPGVYDAHDFFLPSGRGAWALRVTRSMLGMMFAGHDARMIWAQTPVEYRACRMFNRWLGFKSEGVSSVVLLPDEPAQEVETFVLTKGDLCP